jgi:GNAT superfamily N-acetyltransferase
MKKNLYLTFYPLTARRWKDFETLFGKRGACGGCWCMWWRITRREFDKQKGEANRIAMKALVDAGEIPGLLVYQKTEPIGWISLAPREKFPTLERSRILKPIDQQKVWSIVCFFIDKRYRNQGVSRSLLKSAIDYVFNQGGNILEGYPIEPKKSRTADIFAYTGLFSSFIGVGFTEVARRSETRPIMRFYMNKK